MPVLLLGHQVCHRLLASAQGRKFPEVPHPCKRAIPLRRVRMELLPRPKLLLRPKPSAPTVRVLEAAELRLGKRSRRKQRLSAMRNLCMTGRSTFNPFSHGQTSVIPTSKSSRPSRTWKPQTLPNPRLTPLPPHKSCTLQTSTVVDGPAPSTTNSWRHGLRNPSKLSTLMLSHPTHGTQSSTKTTLRHSQPKHTLQMSATIGIQQSL